jgi:DNA polymerase (family X)
MDKSNSDIAMFLRRTADLMELHDENPFKVRSYRTASATVEDVASPLAEIASAGGAAELQKLPGVGKNIAAHILEYLETGTSAAFERLRDEIPESAADLLLVRGIGMKMATTLYRNFGILDLEDLARFAEGGGFEAIAGLGDKSIARLVNAVAAAVAATERVALADADRLADALASGLAAARSDAKVIVAGEVRRRRAEVTCVELLAVVADDAAGVGAALVALPLAAEPIVLTADRAEIATREGVRAALFVAAPRERVVALVRATGSRRHVRQLEERAEERGLALRRDGLFDLRAGAEPEPIELADEADLYARLGLAYVEPERREGLDEVTS